MLISFCIPVYNAKEYLNSCIESIYQQNITRFEIICIDDCSTDGSYEYLCELSEKHPELVVKRNETNRGISYSRNQAIKASRGKYIWFVDSDDMMSPGAADLYLKIAEKESADAVLGNLNAFKDGSLPEYKTGTDNYRTVSFSQPDEFYPKRPSGYPLFAVWLGIFNRYFLLSHDVWFREKLSLYEDYTFYFELGMASPRAVVVDHYGYCYRVRANSASHGDLNVLMKRGFECSKNVLSIYEDYKNRCTRDLRDAYNIHVFIMKRQAVGYLYRMEDTAYVKEGLRYLKKNGYYPFAYDTRADFSQKLNWKTKLLKRGLTKEFSFWIIRFIHLNISNR